MQGPHLTPIHAEKGLLWALRWQHFEPLDWARVYFSEECTVERGMGARQEWTLIRPKDQVHHHPVEGSQVQMVYVFGKPLKYSFF